MNTKTISRFIVIDDDSFNNMVCCRSILTAFPKADIQTFTDPKAGLYHLLTKYKRPTDYHSILFLDIYMPILDGWQFLDRFSKFPDIVKQQIGIYLLTSSEDIEDKKKIMLYPHVSGFIQKPLEVHQLFNLFSHKS